jgi:hypothetical protein
MKTFNIIATALSLTLPALGACGGGQPDAEAPNEAEAPDKEGIADDAMEEMDESIEDVEDKIEDAEDDLDEG